MRKVLFVFFFFLIFKLYCLDFVVLGDSRGKKEPISPYFSQIIKEVKLLSPDFIIHTGDWTKSCKKENWEKFLKIIGKVEIPYFLTVGNHDVKKNWDDWTSLYKELIKKPIYYSFKYENCTFIVLCCYINENGMTVSHKLGKEQFLWFENQLKEAKDSDYIFIFVHEPLFPVDGHIGGSLDFYPEEREKLISTLKPYKDKIILFCGHEHLYSAIEKEGIRQIITGGAGAPVYTPPHKGGFYHFIFVNVKGKKLKMAVIKAGTISEVKF